MQQHSKKASAIYTYNPVMKKIKTIVNSRKIVITFSADSVSAGTVCSLNCNQYAGIVFYACPSLSSSGWIREIVILASLSIKLLKLFKNAILHLEVKVY